MMPPRKFNETDQQYLERLAAEGQMHGSGTIEILVTKSLGLGYRQLAWIRVLPDGAVNAKGNGRRVVCRMKPPPSVDETPFRLIERIAAACREVGEF